MIPLSASVMVGSGRLISATIDFLTMTYLMRHLGPEPFGLIAMVWALIMALSVLKDAGAGESLVSDRHFSKQKVGAATFIAGLLGASLFLLIWLLTPLIVAFYDNDELQVIWLIAGALAAISCMGSIPHAIAQRQENFGIISWSPILGKIMAAWLAIWMISLQTYPDFWPILVYSTVSGVVSLATIWLLVRPRMHMPSLDDVKDVLHYSKGVAAFSLLNTLNRNADNVIVGRFLGEQALGLYMLSYRVLMYPLKELGGVVQIIAFPRLSKMSGDLKAVGLGLSDVMRDVALMTTPFCVGAAVAASEIIGVIFGEAWMGALIPFQVLALVGVFQAPFAQMGMAYTVSRKTAVMAKWALWTTPIIVASFFAGLPWGIEGVAIAYAVVSISLIVPMSMVASRVLGVSSWLLLKGPLRGMSYGMMMSLPMLGCYAFAQGMHWDAHVVLLATILSGAITEFLVYRYIMRMRQVKSNY